MLAPSFEFEEHRVQGSSLEDLFLKSRRTAVDAGSIVCADGLVEEPGLCALNMTWNA